MDLQLQRGIVRVLIDALYDVLHNVAGQQQSFVYVVDVRGELKEGDWADEIHATSKAFAGSQRGSRMSSTRQYDAGPTWFGRFTAMRVECDVIGRRRFNSLCLGALSATALNCSVATAKQTPSKHSPEAIAAVAGSEVEHLYNETPWSPAVMARLNTYCQELACAAVKQGDHFSGIFVSWCLRQAGFSAWEFPLFLAHRDYIRRGFRDERFVFKAMPFDAIRPARGDIISFSREGPLSFSRLVHTSNLFKLESTICLQANQTGLEGAIGNWPEGRIGRYALEMNESGYLKQRDEFQLVSILRLRSALED
ncbi:hypothetical protein [Rhizobium leguminosarum]|uniref:hypothetical protein n=1 Tax=Rhizobium leguminosarum TaxID=384 RepID=UPI003F9E930B